ncbi:hypothetical protein [Pseudolabrys sp. FHR47]|uniref:hypothetical protein n=1 Tax=Pseudolabrys sp. FHR47 TaxID=2562284 RepID=UPI0010BE3938|nr:hypothetical protein [Pseudolabrys sp. FHR47]
MFTLKSTEGPAFAFYGVVANESVAAARHVIESLFPDNVFPPLRSDPVQVVREDSEVSPTPMHVVGAPFELILLNCGVNRPWQFSYQFGHELTHLAARSDLRFGKSGRHSWIEEALCGAGSIYALRRMAKEGGEALEAGAQNYLLNPGLDYSSVGVTPEWFATNSASIFVSSGETSLTAKIAAAILDACPDGSFIFDNRMLIEVPLNPDLDQYLAAWEKLVPAGKVPTLLRSLALP